MILSNVNITRVSMYSGSGFTDVTISDQPVRTQTVNLAMWMFGRWPRGTIGRETGFTETKDGNPERQEVEKHGTESEKERTASWTLEWCGKRQLRKARRPDSKCVHGGILVGGEEKLVWSVFYIILHDRQLVEGSLVFCMESLASWLDQTWSPAAVIKSCSAWWVVNNTRTLRNVSLEIKLGVHHKGQSLGLAGSSTTSPHEVMNILIGLLIWQQARLIV
jgi:hypothetical protein